jgi:hypothetical protein
MLFAFFLQFLRLAHGFAELDNPPKVNRADRVI